MKNGVCVEGYSQTHWSVNAVLFVNVLGKDLFMLFPLKLLCASLQSLITKQAPVVLNADY